MVKKLIHSSYFICIVVAVLMFTVYLFSLCPTVYLIDSGELASVSYTLGIAHPTGYPLYTLISYLFAHLPGEPIRNLNILSSLFTLSAAVFLYFTAKKILKNGILPIICVALFAFSPTIWRISVTNEVYPLTALSGIIIIYTLQRLHDMKGLYLIMYLIGLAFANHIIIFSLAIPVFFYVILTYKPPLKNILIGILFAALGTSIYLYLITRTVGGAALAWGNTYNLQRLIWHVTGKQYQVWMFSLSAKEIFNNLVNGLAFLLRDFIFILIIPVLFGFYNLFRQNRRIFWLFLSIFLFNLFYAINYSIPDIESYYIPGLISLLIVFAYGLETIAKYLKWFIVAPLAIVIPILNYSSTTLRNNTFALDFSRSHIEQLPDKSLVICTFWDIYSPTIYLRNVKKFKSDLIIIDKELLRRTWYIKYIKDEYPEFYQRVSKAVESYLVELHKFEYDQPYNRQTIQQKFIKMLERFVDSKIDEGVFFATPFPDNDMSQVKPNYQRIPRGLVFELRKDTTGIVPFDFSKLKINKPQVVNDERLGFNIEISKKAIQNNILYLNTTKQLVRAEQARNWLKDF